MARRRGGGCDGREDGNVDAMLQCQKVSDFLIAASYLSIPLELLYFASCADLAPLKWQLLQLTAFAVLGGATHLLAVLTHHHPHSSRLLLASTATKLLTALVSFATAVSLLTFIPRLLRIKLRESLLRNKARQLDRDVSLIRRRVEASSRVVRMLTHHIRSSPLDAHAILHTTMLHLADALALQSCAVWIPGHDGAKLLHLVHQLSLRDDKVVLGSSHVSISADDPDVVDIMGSEDAKVLRPGSALACQSAPAAGAVAAVIRMPMLKVSNFNGGRRTSAEASSSAAYAILVLVLQMEDGELSRQELEMAQVVADQVAVALSHAAFLEESQSMRDKLGQQQRALLQAKHQAVMATNAMKSIQSAMCDAMRRPMHSIVGLLSIVRPEQRLVADAIARTSTLLCTLVDDVDTEALTMNQAPFALRSVAREAMSVAGCLSACRGVGYDYEWPNMPEWMWVRVVGDETRVFQVLLHMVGALLSGHSDTSSSRLSFSVSVPDLCAARCNICVKFQVGMEALPHPARSSRCRSPSRSQMSMTMCNKIVQMMNGSMWWSAASDQDLQPQGVNVGGERITLVLQFQLLQHSDMYPRRLVPASPVRRFDGLRILLADSDDMSREVTRKLLEKLGCQVTSVSSGVHCLTLLGDSCNNYHLVLVDLGASTDGFEVALRIRELGSSGCWLLVVVALAAVTIDDGVREMCRRSGINGLIQKPVTLAQLAAQLSCMLLPSQQLI